MSQKCKWCGSTNTARKGNRKSETDNETIIAYRFLCKDCGKRFSIKPSSLNEQEKHQFKYEERSDGNATVSSESFKSRAGEKVKVLDEFLDICQVDLDTWEVDKYVLNAWDVTMGDDNGASTYTNYQIKVWLKRKSEIFDQKKFTKELIEDIKNNYAPNVQKIHHNEGNNLFVPNIYDVHLGRLCWHEETGQNYDVKIAENIVRQTLHNLFKHANGININRILFPVGNDFLNYDYAEPYPMTTNQTPQESDVRWQKMFRIGRNILYEMIDWMYQNIAPVDVVAIPGNHEEQSLFFLAEVLSAKYLRNKNVTVDNRPINRKYYQYGSNLLGFAHGKDEKDVELHNLMSLEAPKLWAETKYRYYYLGHNHHEKSLKSKTSKAVINQEADYKGVLISYLPSVAHIDKYEHKKGYEGSVRGARAMVHHKEKGRTHIIGENI
jgi:hypothetical protein